MTCSPRLRRRSVAIVLAAAGLLFSASLLDAATAGASPVEHETAAAEAAAPAGETAAPTGETAAPARTPERDELDLILSGVGILGGGTAALFLRRRM